MSKYHLIALLAIFLFTIPVRSQDSDRLQVVGKAIFKATPENFVLQIDLKVSDSLYDLCSERLLSKLDLVQKELISKGLEKVQIQTLDLSISERLEYIEGRRVKDGYTGRVRLQVKEKYSPEKLGAVIQVPKNHQLIYKLNFALTDDQKSALSEMAIAGAIENAKTNAALIAKASGVELLKISKINYETSNFGNYQLIQESEVSPAMRDSAQELDLSPKTIEIRKSVAMEWQIKM